MSSPTPSSDNSLDNEDKYYAFYSTTQLQNTKREFIYVNKDGEKVYATEVVNCSYFSSLEEAMYTSCQFKDVVYKGIVCQWIQTIECK